jgi:hypothetical protein
MARAGQGRDAAAQDAASRMLITGTGAGVAARDMGAIALRAAPAAGMPVPTGIAVSIHIMAPAISVWKRPGWLGLWAWPRPAGLVSRTRVRRMRIGRLQPCCGGGL